MPNRLVSLVLAPVAIAAVVMGALSGCAPAVKSPSASHSHKAPGGSSSDRKSVV